MPLRAEDIGAKPDPGAVIPPSPGLRVTLYVSPDDRALSTAGWLFGSIARLGRIDTTMLSHTRIDERGLSTAFQFGEFAGTGVNFGDHREYGAGVRIQHISNGRIKEPNCGATFGEVRISYRWE